jgi:formylglycine-generating enzyme required for sulfatase activity
MKLRVILLAVTALCSVLLDASGRLMADSAEEITNSIGMKLVLIPKGTFQMGSTSRESGRGAAARQHSVTISSPYWLGIHEVTQAHYETVNPMVVDRSAIGRPPAPAQSSSHRRSMCTTR